MRTALAVIVVSVATVSIVGAASSSSGDVWKRLYRPLHLPHLAKDGTCPATTRKREVKFYSHAVVGYGAGPYYPLFPYAPHEAALALPLAAHGPGFVQSLFWFGALRARAALVRGARLDARYRVRFGLRGRGSLALKFPWSGEHKSTMRFRAGGCYGLQIDTPRYSRVVVFQAKVAPVRDSRRVVEDLRQGGLQLDFTDAYPPSLFGLNTRRYSGPAGDVELFEFVDPDAASNAAHGMPGSFSLDPNVTVIVDFFAPSHWFLSGATIVLYVGDDPKMLGPLEQVLGTQLAGD